MIVTIMVLVQRILILLFCSAPTLEAKEVKPLWELGLATLGIWSPDYPGASQGKMRYLPIPYGIYRGPFLRADEDGGIRGRFINESRWEVDLSVAAAFPADSSDNDARRDMPDLDWVGEVGPRLKYHVLPKSFKDELTFSLPVHVVFSTDFGRMDGRGYLAAAYLVYRDENFIHPRLTAAYSVAGIYGTRQLNEYFYEVSPQYATSERPAYRAKEGFMGSKIGLGVIYEVSLKKLWVAVGYQGSSYAGTANESSPLMKARWTNAGAMAIIWKFMESEQPGFH